MLGSVKLEKAREHPASHLSLQRSLRTEQEKKNLDKNIRSPHWKENLTKSKHGMDSLTRLQKFLPWMALETEQSKMDLPKQSPPAKVYISDFT